MNMDKIKELAKTHGFRPNKRLGQNFLVDNNIKEKILSFLPLSKDLTVVEIGPGFGMMTFDLAERCGRLIAIEKDPRVCEIMEEFFAEKGNIELICGDILETDIARAAGAPKSKILVYGNVPYYITTPIVEAIIEQRSSVSELYMVIQEELADRLVAVPGSKIYGSISCFVQYYTKPEKVFKISQNCFFPRPKVNSCLIRMEFLEKPRVQVADEEFMFKLIRKAFSQRRKKMLNPLSDGWIESMDKNRWKEVLTLCGVDLSARAEELSLEVYAALADKVMDLL
ncbi:MAG: 16S rRNA (adenine(1518)-N(6)/adenine(1519)-N(6))-dimethyltransferase RsmA [Candidatus Tantalella remota]|nr:16S rRNA (adenine(1518)-N(6)/adenine(1519)-N(6))-dimethyltransferase RsmA [Candidatus Tantalella remota]